jgi:signal transduction histidine kinase/ligand-binding sensor domain-containing protein
MRLALRITTGRLVMLFCLASVTVGTAGEDTSGDQRYIVKVWGADDGLTEGSVTDVAQTPEGYLWIGTLFGSVLRFDGTRFVSFSSANTPEFSLKWGVPRLMVDQQGTLWISTYDGGMTTWDQRGFRPVFTSTNTPNRLLWSAPGRVIFAYAGGSLLSGQKRGEQWEWTPGTLPGALPQSQQCADAEGRIWYLRNEQEIGIWDAGETKSLALTSELEGQRVAVLTADSRGHIWIGTDQTLAEWRADRFEVMTPTNGEAVLKVKRIIASGSDGLWVEANGRIRRCTGRSWRAESEGWNRELGKLNALRFVHGDAEGGLWSGVGDLGLIHVGEDGAFQRLTTRDGLPSNRVQFAYQDREGNTWTGYERGGLVRVRRRLFRVIGNVDALNENLINSVCEDNQGVVWIGTHVGTVARCENGVCTNLDLPVTARAQDSTVAADLQGRLWIGSQGAGLLMWTTGHVQQIASPAQLQGYARLMLPDRDGRLWIGTLLSIFSVSDGQLTREYLAQTTGDHPTGIAETANGIIWVGTLSGNLLRREGNSFVRVEPPERNSLGRIWALWPGSDGGLWAGTSEGGLLHWRDGKFHRFTTKDGLPSDSIEQILGDTRGNLWLGTRAGIVRVAEADLAQFEAGELDELSASIYGPADGLLTIGSAIMFQPNCWKGRDGNLFFAMANSVAAVNPKDVRINPIPPTVVLESVRVDEKQVWPERVGAVLTVLEAADKQSRPALVPAIKVGPGRGDVEFRYTGLSLGAPSLVRFKYKLEGLENDWNEAGGERKAVYRHVPPGEHIFRVIACNSDGVCSEESALLTVIVRPHFYQTFWFQGGTGVAALAGLSLAVGTTMRRRMKRRLEDLRRQHDLERERARIARDLHDDLGAGLTEISLLGGMLQSPGGLPERSHLALPRIVQRCRDLVTALDEIVWAVNPRNDSANSLSSYLCRYAQEFLEPTAIRCRLEVQEADPDHPLDSEQRHNLFLAFKEVLTNVVRHSKASEVSIRISLAEQGRLLIGVEDNGQGLPETVGENADGLANLRRRMAHIGGACEIVTREGGGVAVRLSLPLSEKTK